ncbi:MAG: hypothetical protein ABUL49_00445 [bacterium]
MAVRRTPTVTRAMARPAPVVVSRERAFTRTWQGRTYDNGLALRPAVIVQDPPVRRYFPQQYAYYPYYRPTYNTVDVFLSPFSFFFGVNAPYISREHCYVRPDVLYVDVPSYRGADCIGYTDATEVNYYSDPVLIRREPALYNAIDDVRECYDHDNIESLVALTDPNREIAVYLQGKYAYSTPASDYCDLTRDALRNTSTISFELNRVHRRSDRVYVVSGRHIYRDRIRHRRTVYVSYVFEDIGDRWTLIQVGTSPDRIQVWG